MKELPELVDKYKDLCKQTEKAGTKIGKTICELLKPVIPDIRYSLGWEEKGINTICFWSKKGDVDDKEHYYRLMEVIEEAFPELEGYIDTPFGVYLTKEDVKKIKEIFKREN